MIIIRADLLLKLSCVAILAPLSGSFVQNYYLYYYYIIIYMFLHPFVMLYFGNMWLLMMSVQTPSHKFKESSF